MKYKQSTYMIENAYSYKGLTSSNKERALKDIGRFTLLLSDMSIVIENEDNDVIKEYIKKWMQTDKEKLIMLVTAVNNVPVPEYRTFLTERFIKRIPDSKLIDMLQCTQAEYDKIRNDSINSFEIPEEYMLYSFRDKRPVKEKVNSNPMKKVKQKKEKQKKEIPEGFITTLEASKMLNCAQSTITRNINKGNLYCETIRRLRYVRESDIKKIISNRNADDTLTMAEAAKIIGCDRSTLVRNIKYGKLKATLKNGKYRIAPEDFNDFKSQYRYMKKEA